MFTEDGIHLDEMADHRVERVIAVNLEMFWPRIPIYLVWAIGLFIAWRRRRQHPGVSRITMLALAGFLLYYLLGIFLGSVIAELALSKGWDRHSIETWMRGVEVIDHCIHALLWVLVLIAIFGSREQQTASRTEPEPTATPPPE